MPMIKRHILSSSAKNLKTAAIISAVLVLPFMILELVNRRDFHNGFPIPLFGFMWLLAFSFIVSLMPILRTVASGNRNMPSLLSFLPRVVLSILIAWLWVGLILDQMPCFLGVPNCD